MSDSHDSEQTVYATDPESIGSMETDRSHWPDHTDAEWLHWHYWILNRSQSEMAEMTDVSYGAISYWMDKHDISTQDRGEAISSAKGGDRRLFDGGWLRDQYHDNNRSSVDIADQLGCDKSTVLNALKRHGIETRSNSEAARLQSLREFGDRGYNDETWLRHQYHAQGKSAAQIARENGWGYDSVRRALNRHGIQTRSQKAANLLQTKQEKCPTDTSDRDLVTPAGIDASWQDGGAGTDGCYLDYRDPTWIREQVRAGRSVYDIADRSECDVTGKTVRRWLKRFDIEPAGGGE